MTFSSPDVINVIRKLKLRWAGYVARMRIIFKRKIRKEEKAWQIYT
jgi:hypothetical protein